MDTFGDQPVGCVIAPQGSAREVLKLEYLHFLSLSLSLPWNWKQPLGDQLWERKRRVGRSGDADKLLYATTRRRDDEYTRIHYLGSIRGTRQLAHLKVS